MVKEGIIEGFFVEGTKEGTFVEGVEDGVLEGTFDGILEGETLCKRLPVPMELLVLALFEGIRYAWIQSNSSLHSILSRQV